MWPQDKYRCGHRTGSRDGKWLSGRTSGRERQGWIKQFEKLKSSSSSSSSSSNKEEAVAWVRKAVMDSQVRFLFDYFLFVFVCEPVGLGFDCHVAGGTEHYRLCASRVRGKSARIGLRALRRSNPLIKRGRMEEKKL